MKKILIISILSLLLTGCSAECNIKINKNLSITESNKIYGIASNIGKNYATVETGIMARINSYYYYDEFSKYNYKVFDEDEYAGATFTRNYDTIEEWLDSHFVKTIFYKGTIEHNDDLITISFKLNNENGYLSPNISDPNFYLSPILINITIPFKIVDGNYDLINDNTLIWNYNGINISDELKFTFNKNLLKDGTKIDISNNKIIKTNKNNIINIIYILVGIFGIIFLGIFLIYKTYRKKNKI